MPGGLKPVPDLPGVWRSPDAVAGGAATYAFIVGISKYDLLDGTPATLGLNSLYVSALTAYRFFRYLAASYEFDGGPMVEATLLLSPTPEEQRIFDADPAFPITPQSAPRPTLDVLRTQLQTWAARLSTFSQQNPASAQASRLFFFFSGHGLEMDPDRQLLLPVDYPGPGGVFNNAVSTTNIHRGLGSVPITSQYFFIDACRSDVPSLYNLVGLTGQDVLDVRRGQYDRDAPIMYASAPGDTAWQPTVATSMDDVSFYGKTLLDALLVRGSFRPDCTTTPCTITFFALFNYVMKTLIEDLKAHNINRPRPIASGGIVRDSVISQWTQPPPPPPPAPPPPSTLVAEKGGDVPWNFVDIVPHFDIRALTDVEVARQTSSRDITGPDAAALDSVLGSRHIARADARALREAVGHASVGDLFAGATMLEWHHDGGWVPAESDVTIVDVERTADGTRAVVHYRFDEPKNWHWIHAQASPLSYGFLHPASTFEEPVFALEFTMQLDKQGAATEDISDVILRLSGNSANSLPLRNAAAVWDAYRASSAIGGLQELSQLGGGSPVDAAIGLFFEKASSPLAATIASMVLLRTDSYAALRDWYERLATQIAESSDAAVFCLQILRLQQQLDASAALRYLDAVAAFGTPATSEACAYLIHFINDFVVRQDGAASPLGAEFDRQAREYVDVIFRDSLSGYSVPFATIARSLRTGGLFTTLAAPDVDLLKMPGAIA